MYNATPATPFVESPKDLIFKIVEHYFIKIVLLLVQLKTPVWQCQVWQVWQEAVGLHVRTNRALIARADRPANR